MRLCIAATVLLSLVAAAASSSPPVPKALKNDTSVQDFVWREPGTAQDVAPSVSVIAAGAWGASNSLQTARQDFRALVLEAGPLQGQVLAVGGCCNSQGSLAGSEILDPSSGIWRMTGDLQYARWLFQAGQLSNGSVLAIGGFAVANGGVLNSTELFEPTKGGGAPYGSWRQVAQMQTPRQDFALVMLDSGEAMAVGGFMASAEVFNPEQNVWTRAASMEDARSSFQAIKLSSGEVLAIGGRGRDSGALSSSELYDPKADSWKRQGDMHSRRTYFAAVELLDGRVMAAGGRDESGRNLNSSEIFDPKTGDWTEARDMNYQRTDLQAVSLQSGEVLVVGGLGGRDDTEVGILDTAELYNPTTGEWQLTDPMLAARYVFQLVTLGNSSVMAIGGTGKNGYTASTEIFNL